VAVTKPTLETEKKIVKQSRDGLYSLPNIKGRKCHLETLAGRNLSTLYKSWKGKPTHPPETYPIMQPPIKKLSQYPTGAWNQ